MPPVLEVRDLSKRYQDREAVHSLSFQLAPGEIFGLLGPNGAGKTTTIGMIAGVLRPTAGSVRILGADAVDCPGGRRCAISASLRRPSRSTPRSPRRRTFASSGICTVSPASV